MNSSIRAQSSGKVATRRIILETAATSFDGLGYANVSLTDLIVRSNVTKGAFYYHFANREAVAAAVISEADDKLRGTMATASSDPDHRALENFVRSVFAVADLAVRDTVVRVGLELRNGLRHITPSFDGYTEHRRLCADAVAAGITDGDLRPDLVPDQAGHTLSTAILGTHQHCTAATAEDLRARLTDVLLTIVPTLCTPESAPHYREFIRRPEVIRCTP